jgi:hypothetical protein
MARASLRLIGALRQTAARLAEQDTVYRWSMLAHCNCGHLTQTITGLSPDAIHEAAARQRGDWAEQARAMAADEPRALDYGSRPALDEGAWEPEDLMACPVAERSMTQIFSQLLDWGLEPTDVGALERLDDPQVRRRLGTHKSEFLHSDRNNVIAYLEAWAAMLEERLTREHAEAAARGDGADELPLAAE